MNMNLLDEFSSESDSDDEILWDVFHRTRKAKTMKVRPDNFNEWDENAFFMRFRLRKETVLRLLEEINDLLETPTDRNDSVSPINQLLLTLRYFATGSMLITAGDFSGIHKSTASRIIKRVSEAIANLRNQYLRFPDPAERHQINRGFFEIARFPRVIGAIDCTHIKIKSPGGNEAENFRNRKGYFSMNVQTICDSNLKILDIVARWPGSVHDQTIFNNSVIKARFDRGDMGNCVLIGDSGYGVGPYMMTPLRNYQPARKPFPGSTYSNTKHNREKLWSMET